MKLKDILDDTALRGFLNWKYPFYPYHEQLKLWHKEIPITQYQRGN